MTFRNNTVDAKSYQMRKHIWVMLCNNALFAHKQELSSRLKKIKLPSINEASVKLEPDPALQLSSAELIQTWKRKQAI